MNNTNELEVSPMTVQLLEGFRLWVCGNEVSLHRKYRQGLLLAYLACPRLYDRKGRPFAFTTRRTATRAELVRVLWAEDDMGAEARTGEQNRARLRRLLADLQAVLESVTEPKGCLLVYQGQNVSLQNGVATDMDAILPSLHRTRQMEPALRAQALLSVLRLFRGELLPGLDAPWIDQARTDLALLYVEVFEGLANLLLQKEPERLTEETLYVARHCWIYLNAPLLPFNRCDACVTLLMRLHLRVKEPQMALAQYARLQQALPSDESPSTEAQELRGEAEVQARASLPARQRSAILGRDIEIVQLEALLLARPPLVTLTGPPGVGKTRLAHEMVTRLRYRWGGCVCVVTLQEMEDASQVYDAILRGMNVNRHDTDALDQAVEALSSAPCLLLLDNCEHLLTRDRSLTDVVSALLARVPALTCLATSQIPLRLEMEAEYRLAPLSLPVVMDRLDKIQANASVQLFMQQARFAGSRFDINEQNADDIARLCALLDGLPLGLSLMGGWAGVRSPAQMLAGLNLLRSQPSPRSRRERHPTLHAAVQWSYDLLTAEQQFLLHCLATFQGSWDIEAATQVTAAAWRSVREGRIDAPLALSGLCDRSLVEVEAEQAEPRFRLLETVRDFAQERLAATGEERPVRDAHARYFAALAEASSGEMRGVQQGVAVARLRRENNNLRAALAWCFEAEGEAEAGVRLALALVLFWEVGGGLKEARRWYEQALNRITATENTRLRARVHGCMGVMAWKQGDYAAARVHHVQSLELCRQIGEERGSAYALLNLGLVAKSLGEYEEAQRLYGESLSVWRQIGDADGEAHILFNLASVAQEQGEFEQAASHLEATLLLLRATGPPNDVGRALNNLGNVRRSQGQLGAAHALYEEALRLQRELGSGSSIAIALLNLAHLASTSRDFAAAQTYLAECLTLIVELGDKNNASYALSVCVDIACAYRQWQRAARLCGAVEALRREIGADFPPAEQAEWKQAQQETESAIGASLFLAEATIGGTWKWEEALRFALTDGLPPQ